jgi:hypothetical protein
MKAKRTKSIGAIFAEGKPIDAAIRKAAREAVRKHQLAGLPIMAWRNSKIVYLPPGKFKSSGRARAGRKAS